MEKLLSQLNKITQIPGISGNEKRISDWLRQAYQPYCDEIVYDNLGSIYAVKKSKKVNAPKVMITAHMDEVGLIVTKIKENGLVKALLLGQRANTSLVGQSVQITTRTNKVYYGVILEQNKEHQALDKQGEVLIDVGFMSENQAQQAINIGDMVTFWDSTFTSSDQQVLFSANWNGRINVSQTVDVLTAVYEMELAFDLYVGCTVQEQVGLRGAQTATNLVTPDLALVLDVQKAWDYQSDSEDHQGVLGKGVLLTYYDKSVLPNRLLLQTARELCDQQMIPYQLYYSMDNSDAGWINKLQTGCPTLLLSVPVRNLFSGVGSLHLADYQGLVKLAIQFIKSLTTEQITAFKQENR